MRFVLAAAAVALLAAVPAGSAARPTPVALIEKGLAAALAAGRLDADEVAAYRNDLAHARAERSTLPPLRAKLLTAVIADVAAQWRSYTKPRALTLFSTLSVNADWLAGHALTAPKPDLTGEDGAVYRFFSSHGYVFHPLANVAKLNSLVSAGDLEGTEQLAAALLARAVPSRGALLWEYEFPFSTGRPPWTSGMAQAVAAQALARAGDLLSDPELLDAADAAYAAVGRLLSPSSPAKPWVALYSFDRVPVLNAQLQAALSVGDYAEITGNADADVFATRMIDAARTLLPRFDTGYWSLYSLKGDESPLDYHDYVIGLLRKLATRTGDSMWSETADHLRAYEAQPPIVRALAAAKTVRVRPKGGHAEPVPIRFWLSKRSTVTVLVAGKRITETLGHGRNAIEWAAGKASPGVYHPILTAVAPGGQAVVALPPITVVRKPDASLGFTLGQPTR